MGELGFLVMAGLVRAILVLAGIRVDKKTWMPGTSSAKMRFALLPGHDGNKALSTPPSSPSPLVGEGGASRSEATGEGSVSADIRFIFCHAGGSVPMVASRMIQYGPKDLAERLPQGVDYELKRLYYDIAVGGNRRAIAALASLIPVHQILFGSDFPYRPLGESADSMPQLGLQEADQYAIGRDNALAPLPRLKAG